jgi:hypothetical protein
MRLKSQIWVSAYLRQCSAAGIFAVVARRGDPSAGAIFIKLLAEGERTRLFVPAPQMLSENGERKWMAARGGDWLAEAEADAIIEREAEFDSDLWVVAVEDREGRHLLADHLVEGEGI